MKGTGYLPISFWNETAKAEICNLAGQITVENDDIGRLDVPVYDFVEFEPSEHEDKRYSKFVYLMSCYVESSALNAMLKWKHADFHDDAYFIVILPGLIQVLLLIIFKNLK